MTKLAVSHQIMYIYEYGIVHCLLNCVRVEIQVHDVLRYKGHLWIVLTEAGMKPSATLLPVTSISAESTVIHSYELFQPHESHKWMKPT